MEQAAVDLERDPLTRVLVRAVEHGRTFPVRDLARVLRHLEGDDRAALDGVPDHLELGERGVLVRERVELVADPARLVPGTPHVEAEGRLLCGQLLAREAVLVALEGKLDTAAGQPVAVACREHEIDPNAAGHLLRGGHVVAIAGEFADGRTVDSARVHLKLVAASPRCVSCENESQGENAKAYRSPFHVTPPQCRAETAGKMDFTRLRNPKPGRGLRSPIGPPRHRGNDARVPSRTCRRASRS